MLKSLVGRMSFRDMTKYFIGRTPNALQLRSRKLGFDSPHVHRIRTKNEKFWEIPNPTNCYWAGFIAADGCITEKRGATSLKLGISIVDLKHLEKFIKDTNFSGKIVHYDTWAPAGKKISHMVRTSISSCQKWIIDLKKNFNLCQGKTRILRGPNLEDDYLKLCFLIGYLDGDGCLHWDKRLRKKNGKGYPSISAVSSSFAILSWIADLMNKHFKVSFIDDVKDVQVIKRTNHFCLFLTGIRAAKVFELLRSIEVPKLDRKWKNEEFLAGIEEYKKRNPEFFTQEMAVKINDGRLVSPDFKTILNNKRTIKKELYEFGRRSEKFRNKIKTLSDDIKKPLSAPILTSKPTFSVAITHSF